MKINENISTDVKNNVDKLLNDIEANHDKSVEDYKKLVGY